jgi:hypothetical protein
MKDLPPEETYLNYSFLLQNNHVCHDHHISSAFSFFVYPTLIAQIQLDQIGLLQHTQ